MYVLFKLAQYGIERTALYNDSVNRFRCFRTQAGCCFSFVHHHSNQALTTKILLAGELGRRYASPAGSLYVGKP
jgi:hypothetical protein